MKFGATLYKSFDRLNGRVPNQALHAELVRALYGPTGTSMTMFAATAAASSVIATAWLLSADFFFLILLIGFLIVGAARAASVWLYHRSRPDMDDPVTLGLWESRALLGAWAFAGLVGFSGAYTVFYYSGEEVEVLISCCVMGYIAGTSSRNASRPLITIGQISFTCIPFLAALLLRADVVHVVLATFITILFAGTILVARSVFENLVSKHEAFKRIETLAHRDVLTGLWNRAAFLELVEKQIPILEKAGDRMALVAIDLDRFKDINDTLGHPVGDGVLQQVADRLRNSLRPCDEASRIGGDEFLVMLAGGSIEEMGVLIQRLLDSFAENFVVNLTHTVCGASIGYAVAPRDGSELEVLLRNADLALYEAKKRGRAQIIQYAPALSVQHETRATLEHELHFALSRGELYLEYQPIVDPRSGRAICCEALLRWRHPELGQVGPDVFIPMAEATGLIVPIGAWVLQTACAEATRWASDIHVAINLSAVQFKRGRAIVDVVSAALADSGLSPSRLDLEITESVLIEDADTVLKILEELRNKDISISLDDFGTGYASLSYLNDFPFSKIKIDRKFCQNIDQSPRTAAIVKGIVQTTRDLHMERVAEGVETVAQLQRMQSFGVNAIQGYLFSRPLPAAKVRELIAAPIKPAALAEPAERALRKA